MRVENSLKIFARLLSLILVLSCGNPRQAERYQIQSVADLTLSQSNHPHGWGKRDCFFCHNPQNIHLENRLGHSSFQFAPTLVNQYGIASCSGCHGSNGVSP